jgi:hypothetical protein
MEGNRRDRFLYPAVKLERVDGMTVTLDDGNRDTTRLGQWDGRGEGGKEGKDKRV